MMMKSAFPDTDGCTVPAYAYVKSVQFCIHNIAFRKRLCICNVNVCSMKSPYMVVFSHEICVCVYLTKTWYEQRACRNED